MIYKVKFYVYKKPTAVVTLKCGDDYFKDLKDDLFDESEYLDLDELILAKKSIKRIKVKKISDN